MPAGYSSRCKVCNSQHRVEIEKWAKEDGLSARVISAKLKEEFGEEISYKSIWQHLNEHLTLKTILEALEGDLRGFFINSHI